MFLFESVEKLPSALRGELSINTRTSLSPNGNIILVEQDNLKDPYVKVSFIDDL
jgi:hypothetical protein